MEVVNCMCTFLMSIYYACRSFFLEIRWDYLLAGLSIGVLYFLFRYYRQLHREKCIYEEKENVFFKIVRETYASLAIVENMLEGIASRELPEPVLKEVQEMTKHINLMGERYRHVRSLNGMSKEMRQVFSTVECELSTYICTTMNQCSAYASARKVKFRIDKAFSHSNCWLNEIIMTPALQCLLEKMIDAVPAESCIDMVVSCNSSRWTLEMAGRVVPIREKCHSLWRILPLRILQWYGNNMPLIEEIIHLHNGKMSVDKKGEMIIYKVSVPISIPSAAKDSLPELSTSGKVGLEKIELPSEEKKYLRVLLIMSNKEMSNYLQRTLSSSYQVVVIESIEDLLHFLEAEIPHVVVIDEFVNGVEGDEICSKLRRDYRDFYLPILLLADCDNPRSYIDHSLCGADKLHPRMVQINKFKADIGSLINNRAIQRAWIMKLVKENYTGVLPALKTKDEDKERNFFLEKLDDLLEKNLSCERYSITLLASDMGLCRTLFYKKLKYYTNETPEHYIFRFKMHKAKIFLAASEDTTITEIAATLGYSRSEYFAKKFRSFQGMPPTEYRKQILGEDL